jgi:threonine/homoserine/homoserine lactone efflux protein
MLEILLFSFLVALTGALSPGPLLTFTIYKSLKEKKGYIATVFILLGHATIELTLILILLAGATVIFQNAMFLIVVGVLGGIFLMILGILLIKNVHRNRIEINFEVENQMKGFKGNSFVGGIVVSISNPFWELWWAVIGVGLMINLNIGFYNPLGLLLFFIGHELGDIVWYLPVSVFIHLGGRSLNPKIFQYVLLACGLFMIIFGIYMMFSAFITIPTTVL